MPENKHQWFALKNTADTTEILLMDEIGGWGDTARYLCERIANIDTDTITVRINSPGGDVYEGLTIMSALQHHPARVVCVVEGMAASIASVIAVGGADELVMRPHATIMIHDAWTFSDGNAAELEKAAEQLHRVSDTLAGIYADKAGGTAEFWRARMSAETWYTADEAVEAGLADVVRAASDDADAAVLTGFGHARALAKYRYGGRACAPAPVLGKTIEKGNPMDFLKDVATRLGVASEDEATVLAALDEALAEQVVEAPPGDVENAETVKASSEDEAPAAGLSHAPDGLTVTVDAAAFAQLQKDAAFAAEARERDAAQRRAAVVDKAIAENRISAAAREAWLDSMRKSEKTTIDLLESMPRDTIPRAELGSSRDGVEDEAPAGGSSDLDRRADAIGLFGRK